MARILVSLGGLGLLVGLLFLPALLFDAGDREEEPGSDPTTITSYVADFTVDEDGGMDVVRHDVSKVGSLF